jgi:hypothetical protein
MPVLPIGTILMDQVVCVAKAEIRKLSKCKAEKSMFESRLRYIFDLILKM